MKKILFLYLISIFYTIQPGDVIIKEEVIKNTPFTSLTLYEKQHDNPIGYCTIITREKYVELGYIKIIKGKRRQGLGSLLLTHAREQSKALKLPMRVLVEAIEGNTLEQSIAFYKHNGGQLVSQSAYKTEFKFT
jgi:GNAT superfamily N-acetyltransferase